MTPVVTRSKENSSATIPLASRPVSNPCSQISANSAHKLATERGSGTVWPILYGHSEHSADSGIFSLRSLLFVSWGSLAYQVVLITGFN